MQKLHFSIEINAPREKVWDTMLGEATYKEWTVPFNPGSYFKGTWEKGSKILFMGPNPETGEEGGMVSRIAENKPHEFLSIEHLGILKNGVEDTTSEEAKKWAPAYENYTFNHKKGPSTNSGQATTELLIDIDVVDEFVNDFNQMWPTALQKLKNLAEQ
jgi:hypothetical protein